jgi:hypothetical protein
VRRGASPLETFAQGAQVLAEAKEALPLAVAVAIHVCKSTDQYLLVSYLNEVKTLKSIPGILR